MSAAQWITLICLGLVIVFSLAGIHFTRQATRNWREARENWERVAELWQQAAERRRP